MRSVHRILPLLVASLITMLAACLTTSLASAQQLGGNPNTALPKQGSKPKQPQTHAAAGAESPSRLPTEAAQLPEDPNKIPEQLRDVLGSDFDPEFESHKGNTVKRTFIPPYYSEESGDFSFKTVFPFWAERKQAEDRSSLYGLLYYQRRSPKIDADVVFPFFWKFRDEQTYTTIAGPVMHRESPKGHDNWVAPVLFEGSHEDGTEYLHIPPLLTFHHRNKRGGFTMIGPGFCTWEGGSGCDNRTAESIDMGVAPFYFYGRDRESEYEVIPPLLHYYHYDEVGDHAINMWGPVWTESYRGGGVFNVFPFLWHNWKDEGDESNLTVLPFFHYREKGKSSTLATLLFVNHIAEDGAHTFASPLYSRHRGRTELDMITPFFWQVRDDAIELEETVIPPFFYRKVSNRDNNLVIFPFYGHFERRGIYEENWITPLVRHRTSLNGWNVNVFPFFHAGRNHDANHLVLAPFFFDFASPRSRQTVVFPFFWRFADQEGVSQLVGNTFYQEEKVKGGTDWQFHFFPFFSYGESPRGHWWNVLYGLAGYTRDGTASKVRVGYIPITLSD